MSTPSTSIAEHFLEILLVADEAVDVGDQRLGGGDRFFGVPEFGAEVEVVGDDRAGFVGGLDGFGDDWRGGFGQGGEDAAGVEPADAVFVEEFFPSRRRRASCRTVAVWPRSYRVTEPRLAAPTSVKLRPMRSSLPTPSYLAFDDVGDVHADGAGVVEDDGAQGEDYQGRRPSRCAGRGARAHRRRCIRRRPPRLRAGGKFDPAMLRRGKAEHALAEADQVVTGVFYVFDFTFCLV